MYGICAAIKSHNVRGIHCTFGAAVDKNKSGEEKGRYLEEGRFTKHSSLYPNYK